MSASQVESEVASNTPPVPRDVHSALHDLQRVTDPRPNDTAGVMAGVREAAEGLQILPPEGQRCLSEAGNLTSQDIYCNATWDTLYCWPATEAGSVAKEMCATVFTDIPDLVNYPDAYAFRECGHDGTWMKDGWTNYSQCLNVIDKQGEEMGVVDAVRYITFIGAILSLVTLTVTIFIFTYFRTLECDRLRVHRNLVASLIVLFIVMLVLTEPFVSNRQTISYRDVDWLCKTLLAIRMYAQMASINWMFVEGLFLHSRLTSNVFDSGAPFPLYYTIGWGAPLVFIVAWSVTMAIHYPVRCWMSYSDLTYVWILVAPMFTTLMINLMFLINIVRILVTKLRASDAQVRKAIKATVVLFPLLGTTNLLFAVNPGDKGEGAYMVTNALLQSSQGVFVSVLYCFLNAEVRKVVQKRWRQYRLRRLGYPDSERRKSTKSTIILPSTFSFRRPTSHNINLHLPPSPRPTSPQSSSVVQAHVNAAHHAHPSSFAAPSQPPSYLAISLHSPSSSSSSSRPPCAFALAAHASPSRVFEPLALDSFPSRLCSSPTQTLSPSMPLPCLLPASSLRHAPSDASSLNHAPYDAYPYDAYPSDACPSPLSGAQQSLETSLL